jgi:hypothetical protein
VERRGEAVRWSGEDGEVNLCGEVGRRGGAARWSGRWGSEVGRRGGSGEEGAAERELQEMVAKSRQQAKPIHGQLRARARALAISARARAHLKMLALTGFTITCKYHWKLVDALVEISNIGNH